MKKPILVLSLLVAACGGAGGSSSGGGDQTAFATERFDSPKLNSALITYKVSNRDAAAKLLKIAGQDRYAVDGHIGSYGAVLMAGDQYRIFCDFYTTQAANLDLYRAQIQSGALSAISGNQVKTGVIRSGSYSIEYASLTDRVLSDLTVSCKRFFSKDVTIGDARKAVKGIFEVLVQ